MTGLDRIVVATDFSPGAEEAWELAQRLAAAVGAEVVLAHVQPEPTLPASLDAAQLREVYESARAWAADRLEQLAARARERGVRVRVALRTGQPHEELIALAAEEGAGLVVTGTHGGGRLDRMLLGSVADRVRRLAPCPVLTVREPAPASQV